VRRKKGQGRLTSYNSYMQTMWRWRTLFMISISVIIESRSFMDSFFSTTFIAKFSLVCRFNTFKTTPEAPFPICSPMS
jgi:hypothetical protein